MEETSKKVSLIGYPMTGKTRLLKRVEQTFRFLWILQSG